MDGMKLFWQWQGEMDGLGVGEVEQSHSKIRPTYIMKILCISFFSLVAVATAQTSLPDSANQILLEYKRQTVAIRQRADEDQQRLREKTIGELQTEVAMAMKMGNVNQVVAIKKELDSLQQSVGPINADNLRQRMWAGFTNQNNPIDLPKRRINRITLYLMGSEGSDTNGNVLLMDKTGAHTKIGEWKTADRVPRIPPGVDWKTISLPGNCRILRFDVPPTIDPTDGCQLRLQYTSGPNACIAMKVQCD